VQNIIDSGPEKIFRGWQMKIARRGLIEINQSKSGVKETYQRLSAKPENYQTRGSKAEVKDIIRRRSAG
jgi:hypothetical protein